MNWMLRNTMRRPCQPSTCESWPLFNSFQLAPQMMALPSSFFSVAGRFDVKCCYSRLRSLSLTLYPRHHNRMKRAMLEQDKSIRQTYPKLDLSKLNLNLPATPQGRARSQLASASKDNHHQDRERPHHNSSHNESPTRVPGKSSHSELFPSAQHPAASTRPLSETVPAIPLSHDPNSVPSRWSPHVNAQGPNTGGDSIDLAAIPPRPRPPAHYRPLSAGDDEISAVAAGGHRAVVRGARAGGLAARGKLHANSHSFSPTLVISEEF